MTDFIIGYVRTSTDHQDYGAEAQRRAIDGEAAARGWDVVWKEDIGRSGKSLERPAVQSALEMMRRGEAVGIIIAKLDRLSRSLADFTSLLRLAQDEGWTIVCLDPQLDLTSPSGRMMAGVLAVFAEFEREMISARVKAGLAEAKKSGKTLGRPHLTADEAVVARIKREKAAGLSLHAIARGLNEDRVPTVRKGKQWYAGTVRSILQTNPDLA